MIHERICALLDEHAPDAVALEELYFGANARSAFAVGQARGVVMLAAGQRGIPAPATRPSRSRARSAARAARRRTRSGGWCRRCWASSRCPTPDHAADALAVAICHANHAPLAMAVAG